MRIKTYKNKTKQKQNHGLGVWLSSEAEHFPSMCETLGSILALPEGLQESKRKRAGERAQGAGQKCS